MTVRTDPGTEDACGSMTEIAEIDLVSPLFALLSLKILIRHCMTAKQLILVNSPAKFCRYSARPRGREKVLIHKRSYARMLELQMLMAL